MTRIGPRPHFLSCLVLSAMLILAFGSVPADEFVGELRRDNVAMAAAVDAIGGPEGLVLGTPLTEMPGIVSTNTIGSYGRAFQQDGRTVTLGPIVFDDVQLWMRSQTLQAVTVSASTPGKSGNSRCEGAAAHLVERLGLPSSRTRWVYPERKWTGKRLEVIWRRSGEMGTDRYFCRVTWALR